MNQLVSNLHSRHGYSRELMLVVVLFILLVILLLYVLI
ncbi:YjcZ family sporulation protein [Paenibacillus sp. GCM10028914]